MLEEHFQLRNRVFQEELRYNIVKRVMKRKNMTRLHEKKTIQ